MLREHIFDVGKLDFATLDASEREFITIEYKDPKYEEENVKLYLLVEGLTDKFTAQLWLQDNEDEPYCLDYQFSSDELDAIKWKLIEYMHCLIYAGKTYAVTEMSIPDGQEAWRGGTSMKTEVQLRQEAKKQGYSVKKSSGGYSGDNLGGYRIINCNTNFIVAGERYNLSLEDVAHFLEEKN